MALLRAFSPIPDRVLERFGGESVWPFPVAYFHDLDWISILDQAYASNLSNIFSAEIAVIRRAPGIDDGLA